MAVHCTNIERVKVRVGLQQADAQDAALLAQWIGSVSAAIEAYLGRGFEEKSRTEILSPRPRQRIVQVSAWPVVLVESVIEDQTGVFDGSSGVAIGPSFFGINYARGRLNFSAWPLGGGSDSLRITYTGGMAPSSDQFIQRWPAIAGAADTQITHQYRRRHSDGYSTVGGTQTGAVGVVGEVIELTPGVKTVLDPFRNLAGLF